MELAYDVADLTGKRLAKGDITDQDCTTHPLTVNPTEVLVDTLTVKGVDHTII